MAEFITLDDDGTTARAAADLTGIGAAAIPKAMGLTRHYGMVLQTRVKAGASLPRGGPPGPRIQTGDYVRSITLDFGGGLDGSFFAVVGTSRPQGRRLEFGFDDTDSLGRVYAQPPYPHWGPAFDLVAPQFYAAMGAIVITDVTGAPVALPPT